MEIAAVAALRKSFCAVEQSSLKSGAALVHIAKTRSKLKASLTLCKLANPTFRICIVKLPISLLIDEFPVKFIF